MNKKCKNLQKKLDKMSYEVEQEIKIDKELYKMKQPLIVKINE